MLLLLCCFVGTNFKRTQGAESKIHYPGVRTQGRCWYYYRTHQLLLAGPRQEVPAGPTHNNMILQEAQVASVS